MEASGCNTDGGGWREGSIAKRNTQPRAAPSRVKNTDTNINKIERCCFQGDCGAGAATVSCLSRAPLPSPASREKGRKNEKEIPSDNLLSVCWATERVLYRVRHAHGLGRVRRDVSRKERTKLALKNQHLSRTSQCTQDFVVQLRKLGAKRLGKQNKSLRFGSDKTWAKRNQSAERKSEHDRCDHLCRQGWCESSGHATALPLGEKTWHTKQNNTTHRRREIRARRVRHGSRRERTNHDEVFVVRL